MMLDTILQSMRDFNLYLVALFVAAFIGGLVACICLSRKSRRLLRDQALILDSVSQGICMFDNQKRLVLCNSRYLEIYEIQNKGIGRGTSLDEIVQLRYSAGTSPTMAKDEYVRWRVSIETTKRQSGTLVELMNGKTVEIRHQPILDGGYVATHEDITERQSEARRQTTFLRALSGLLPHTGSIRFAGVELGDFSSRAIAKAGLVHVIEGHRNFTQQSVADNLLLAAYDCPANDLAARIKEALSYFSGNCRKVPRSWVGA